MSDLTVERADGVLRLTLNRPDSLNALDAEFVDTVTAQVHAADADDGVRVVVLAGAGRGFSSGANLEGTGRPVATLDAGNELVAAITSSPKAFVAAVNGPAAGIGATIALSCDLVVAKRSAFFLLAFVNIGLLPDGGATAIVPAAIGRARAARMALLGERISAEQAYEWGLVSHLADDDAFDTEVDAVASKLAGSAGLAIARTKAALAASTLLALRHAHATERTAQLGLLASDDFAEGVAAFREKRAARFEGR